jgi:autotransporter adhesin
MRKQSKSVCDISVGVWFLDYARITFGESGISTAVSFAVLVMAGGSNPVKAQYNTVNIGNNSSAVANSSVAVGASANALGSGAVAIGSGAAANYGGDVAIGAGSVTAASNPTSSVAIAGRTYSFAGASPASVLSVGAPGAERQITNVAAGRVTATSTDAVNGSQLFTTNTAINSLSTSTSTGLSSLSSGLSTTNGNVASLSAGLNSTNTTVASLSAGMTNIANQLTSLSTTVLNSDTGITADMNGAGTDRPTVTTGSNSVAIGANSTDGGRSNVVSVGSSTEQRQIIDVAAGTEGTDAVNLNQLNALSTSTSQVMQGQQAQINSLSSSLQETDTMARQGIAATTALTMLPQVDAGKTFSTAVGVARFAGQSGMALGASARVTANGILKMGVGLAGSNRTYGAGYGYSW